jgi:hypothetical protein
MDIKTPQEPERPPDARLAPQAEEARIQPWEQIEDGRYRPRRIRGSFPGRELG